MIILIRSDKGGMKDVQRRCHNTRYDHLHLISPKAILTRKVYKKIILNGFLSL